MKYHTHAFFNSCHALLLILHEYYQKQKGNKQLFNLADSMPSEKYRFINPICMLAVLN